MAANEFIFGPREEANQFARKKGWRTEGRALWLKSNGTCVHYLAFEEQLEAVSKGERLYVVGKLSPKCTRALKKAGVVLVI
jgi:hypothetical protein